MEPSRLSFHPVRFWLSTADSSVCEWRGGEGVIGIVDLFLCVTAEKALLLWDSTKKLRDFGLQPGWGLNWKPATKRR